MNRYPLFDRFPALAEALAPVPLANLPTSVHALRSSRYSNLWIKRDDLTHAEYGGNKVRKLEFVLADIRRKKAKHVITFGATGTNAGVATAMLCKQEGLACSIATFPQVDSQTVRKNQKWMHYYGANLIPFSSLLRAAMWFHLSPARMKRNNYFLYAGCSNPVATFAYVNAAFELAEQIRQGFCPEPAQILVPVGSASTLAGLTLGCHLAGLTTSVLGVRVAPAHVGPFAACTTGVVKSFMRYADREIRRICGIHLKCSPEPVLLENYYGSGYGIPTERARYAIDLFRDEWGIELESTYSGKAAAAFIDVMENNKGPLLFWNTYNSRLPPF
ncbi:MAG TPA: pyridoxal-phosphate dependent enzyme [Pseudomonadales bacterium]|nr:pyridoxal-phosphate dependent enzyme [Pseudomonadales bacterium]